MELAVEGEALASRVGALEPGYPVTLRLTLRPCRVAEAEPGFDWSVDEDHCREVNRATFAERTQRALVVSPGEYIVRVTNDAFDRELGLWLRRTNQPETPIISAGGIGRDESRGWTVELEPGTYTYSCPLSPTPDYRLVVR